MSTEQPRRSRWTARAFRALLGLYPGEFRDEYGREVAMVFADRYRDATTAWQRALVWFEAAAGVLKEAPREHVQVLLHDFRFAARMVARSPGFAATVVLTLALGIGANTSVFQLINAVRLRSLPIDNPEELAEVRIAGGNQGFGVNPGPYGQLTRHIWQELRPHQQAFSGAFAWGTRDVGVGDGADLRPAYGIAVSGEFFSVLGIQPWRGRLLDLRDEASGCPTSRVVVSYAYWMREMGGRELGDVTRLRVNRDVHEVIGVTPPGFLGLAVGESFDLALPLCPPARRELFDVAVMGRLRPGWTIERASAHLDALSAGVFDATTPSGYSASSIERFRAFRLAVYPAAAGVSELRTRYDTSLQLLLAITALVLLIACANLANLMLARAIARAREVSVRLALGASRTRLVRQFFSESFLLAVLGAALGLGLAQAMSRSPIWALSTEDGGPTLSLATDWRMLLFTGAVAVAACLVFGVAPALRAARIAPAGALKTGGRAMTGDRGRFSTHRLMVVTQIAVSLVLLVAALLFVRSFRNLMTFDAGMRQAGLAVGRFGFNQAGVPAERISDFRRALLGEVKSVPGILDAATTSNLPLLGSSWGHGVKVGEREGSSQFTWVSPGYFSTMGIPIIEGRDVNLRDTVSSPRVAVVNQTFVRQYAGGRSPLGQTLRTGSEPGYPSTIYEIVGVIADTKYNSLRGETPPMAFAPDSQHPSQGPWAAMMIYSGDVATSIASVRNRIRQVHPAVFMDFSDFQAEIRGGLVRERLLAMLAGVFGAVAALLAMVGLYGMISFTVAQRRHEFGIRTALGARRRQVVNIVMLEAGWLLVTGVVIGVALSLVAGQSAAALLFGLTPHDLPTLLAAASLLGAIALTASFIPARRASRLDPLTALRHEG